MNIAIIGVPGSGKTRLAEELNVHWQGDRKTVAIVDYYAEEVERRVDIAIGPIGSYLSNLHVALERYARERRARSGAEHVVTCGTLIETAVYLSMHFVALMETMNEQNRTEASPRIDAVLRMMAVLYNDTFEYDHAFYLPPENGDEDAAYMDRQLQAGLEGFKLVTVTPLLDSEARLNDALEALSAVHAA